MMGFGYSLQGVGIRFTGSCNKYKRLKIKIRWLFIRSRCCGCVIRNC